nr:aromatic-ring-hydroxylating dioxygenase subunit beta [uncultured Azospirillum sp.]
MNGITTIDRDIDLQGLTAFVWREADILDRCDYDAWLALWTDDGHYIVPIGKGENYEDQVNVCYDDAKMRRMRIERFQQGFSISSAPPADTVRTVSRFVLQGTAGDEIVLRCAEHVVENKFGRQRIYAANLTYTLVRTDDGLRIRNKVARLLNSDGELTAFSYLF